jgi:hypothetical protein
MRARAVDLPYTVQYGHVVARRREQSYASVVEYWSLSALCGDNEAKKLTVSVFSKSRSQKEYCEGKEVNENCCRLC